ncbi:MAG: hypothetical protein GEU26_18160 [Nitrososphaeraceae archaeon]|nr:hypothetical protein [Nitrososphaeraceae archaeon]
MLDASEKLHEGSQIRLNNRKGSSDLLELGQSEPNIRFHSDKCVDLDAIQIGPNGFTLVNRLLDILT